MAQLKCKHQVLPINFYSQFFIEIEWLEHFTTLEACRLDSQWRIYVSQMGNKQFGKMFENWKNNLNPKSGKIESANYFKSVKKALNGMDNIQGVPKKPKTIEITYC